MPDLTEYRDELRETIRNSDSGMLLHAEKYFDADENQQSVFELTSSVYQRSFVTLWELFDERERYRKCIEMFAEKAREIRMAKPYSAIVTCTATAKHLLDQSHSKIETATEKISPHYLGHYPYMNLEHRSSVDLTDQRVLIITDVVASGRLVTRLADVVADLGGKPIGILCVVVTGSELIKNPRIPMANGRYLAVDSLTDFEIEQLGRGDFDKSGIRKIDPVTVLPEETVRLPERFILLFGKQSMFDHFERADAIDFDFYQADERRFTTAVRLKRLLDTCGNEIWAQLCRQWPHLMQGVQGCEGTEPGADTTKPVLVTTFDYQDILFKEYIEDRMAERIDGCVIVPKRDAIGAPFRHFMLQKDIKKLQGRHAIVVLSSVHTSDKLRDLTSLLVSQSVLKITVICLLNRMGVQSLNFVTRIARMLGGIGLSAAQRDFEFIAVYDLPDFSPDSILKMQESVQTVLTCYTSMTRVHGFRRLIDQDRKYFRSQAVTSYEFAHRNSKPILDFPLTVVDEQVVAHTKDAEMLLLCIYVTTVRDYTPLVNALSSIDDKKTLYQAYAILLADLSFVKMNGTFEELRNTLTSRVRELRAERLHVEATSFSGHMDQDREALAVNSIEALVERETHFMFGLSLFSYLDEANQYAYLINEFLFCGLTAEAWKRYPKNLAAYLGAERVALSISMLVHLAYIKDGATPSWRAYKSDLRAAILNFIKKMETSTDAPDNEIATWLKVKTNLGVLVKELNDNGRKENHVVLRYLHSKIMSSPDRHNPIVTSLINLPNALNAVIDSISEVSSAAMDRNRRIQTDGYPRLKQTLEDGMYTAGILQEIAEASRDLFMFALSRNGQSSRFTASPSEEGLARDIMKLGDLLQFARSSNSISKGDVEAMVALRIRILEDLWSDQSELQRALQTYIVPLGSILLTALEWAEHQLRPKYGNVWSEQIKRFSSIDTEWYVLVDPHLLREVLKNALLNVRYQFESLDMPSARTYQDMVDLAINTVDLPVPEPGGESAEHMPFVCLTVTSRGNSFALSQADLQHGAFTVSKHMSDIMDYGGNMTLRPLEDGGAIVRIQLMSRQSLAETLAHVGRNLTNDESISMG